MPDPVPDPLPAPVADLTVDDVARLRLVSQRLVGHPAVGQPADPESVLAHLLAVQAQDLPAAQLVVASRTVGRSTAAVREALDGGHVVRTWPMRGTLHLLTAHDAGWMTRLLGPRALRASAKRWADAGLDDAAFDRALAVAVERLADGPASRDELGAAWAAAGFEASTSSTYRLLNGLATRGELVLGPMRGADQLVVPASTWLPEGSRRDDEPDDVLLTELAARYCAGHGPVSVPDLVRWTFHTVGTARAALGAAAARGLLVTATCEGRTLFGGPELADLVADLDGVRDLTRGVRLLAAFDEMILGYADRSPTVAADDEPQIVPGGNGMFRPVVVDGGRAVATWSRAGRRRDALTVTPFDQLADGVADAAQSAFSDVLGMLER